MPALVRELRYATRQLIKSPGFSLSVVLTLALGIGAAAAMFSLVEGILLRPLPFADPARLVVLGDHLGNSPGLAVTAREIATYTRATSAFASVGGYANASYELAGNGVPEEIHAARLNAGVFPALSVRPILGREFTQQEEDAHQPVDVIGYGFWMSRFQGNPGVLGTSIVLDRRPYTIVGVMPRGFAFPIQNGSLDQAQLWTPLSLTADELSDQETGDWSYHLIARLKPNTTLAQATQDADRVSRQVMREFPASMAQISIRGDVEPLGEFATGAARPVLRTLFLAVAVVLLIACANVTGLLLVRAIRRRREFAIRLALGARSSAILRQSILEGLILSLAGGVLGLALASGAIRTILHLLPDSIPRADSVSVDAGVMGFALLLSLTTGAICSLAPAFAALGASPSEGLKESAASTSASASHARLRSGLVVLEIAIAMVLVTAAAAFLESLKKMQAVDPGFRSDHVLVAGFQLPLKQYSTNASADAFRQGVVDRLRNSPGVEAAGITNFLPGSGEWAGSGYTIEGQPVSAWKLKFARFAIPYGDYFKALRIPLIAGRYLNDDDRADTPLVVLVNQSMAAHCWPGQNPVGRRMHIGNPKKGLPWATVVGIVADTKTGARDEATADQWYASSLQPAILFGTDASGALSGAAAGEIVLRSSLPPDQITRLLQTSVAAADPMLPLLQLQPMADVLAGVEAPRRFNTSLIGAFAAGALLLAITGIYGVVAFSVSLRTQEIAIRMALGAQRSGIARMVLLSAARMALIGCGLGVLGSLAASRLVGEFLFATSATDPLLYLFGSLAMIAVALLAAAIPAARAAQADPARALRAY
jgi:putative ABC transport system permease protein